MAITGHFIELHAVRLCSKKLQPLGMQHRKAKSSDVLAPHYQTISPIGAGAFSMVLRARHCATGVDYAVKTWSKQVPVPQCHV